MTKPCLKEGAFLRSGQSLGPLVKDFSEDNYTVEIILSKGTKQISAAKWIAW
jgi:hypothetical protein